MGVVKRERPRAAARSTVAAEPNPRAVLGANNPPAATLPEPWKATEIPAAEPARALTPFELAEKAVNDAYDEAILACDGAVIDTQELADYYGNLLGQLRKAYLLAEKTRKAEVEGLNKAKAEIQGRYNPLTSESESNPGKTVMAAQVIKRTLAPWLAKVAVEQEAAAKAARDEFDRKRDAAEAAIRATSGTTNLAERAAAEALVTDAKRAEKVVNRAEAATAKAGGMMGARAIGLTTRWVATIADPVIAARHYWSVAPTEMIAFIQTLADDDVRKGCRSIPGVDIAETKQAV